MKNVAITAIALSLFATLVHAEGADYARRSRNHEAVADYTATQTQDQKSQAVSADLSDSGSGQQHREHGAH